MTSVRSGNQMDASLSSSSLLSNSGASKLTSRRCNRLSMVMVQIVVPDAVRLHDVSSSASSPITRSAVVLLVLTTVPHEHSSVPTSGPCISYTMFFDSSAGSEFSTPVTTSQPAINVIHNTTYGRAGHTSQAAPRSDCKHLSCQFGESHIDIPGRTVAVHNSLHAAIQSHKAL